MRTGYFFPQTRTITSEAILILGGQKGDFESTADGKKQNKTALQANINCKVSYHLRAHICSHISSEFLVIPVYCYFKKKNQSLLL